MDTKADTHKAFLVYKSSAGSGKTYTLVKEYMKIVLQNPQSVRNILAITFTNAAAAEMKQRVIKALKDLADLSGKSKEKYPEDSDQLLQNLAGELPLSPSEIINRSQMVLSLILHNYGDFSISTIDSFVHRIIRSFAFDLKLPMNFDVELDQDQLLMQAVDLLVSKAGTEKELTGLLVDYIQSRTDDEKSHFIEYDIRKMAKTLMDEKGGLYVEQLKKLTLEDFRHIYQKLSASIRKFENEILEIAGKASKLILVKDIEPQYFYSGSKGIATYFSNLTQRESILLKINPNSYVIKTIEENKWHASKANPLQKDAIDSIKDELTGYYKSLQSFAEQQLELYKIHQMVKRNIFPMAVLNELEKILDEIKAENSLLHISDFNKKISEIVSVETAPFIYERIGERYQHYMIDEFQDTSTLQWQNLLPLIDNALASGNLNLVVGDGKQAIYRWRDGDVEQFAMLPALSALIKAESKNDWERTLERNFNPKNLETNYRSREKIIEFNNQFFDFAKRKLPESLQTIYEKHQQKPRTDKTDKKGGFVKLEFVEKPEDADVNQQQQTQLRILETIRQLERQNHPLNHITILCRSNKEASETARFLLEKQIDVISSESLLLNQSDEVNFILSIFRILSNSKDQTAFTDFFHFLIQNQLITNTMHEVLTQLNRWSKMENSNATVIEYADNYLHHQKIDFSFEKARFLNLYESAEYIVRQFFSSSKVNPFIAFFMDVLYEYGNKFNNLVPDFLEWWEENQGKQSVVVPEGVNAVQVMTIHKSKGLQFRIVIFPYVDASFSKLGKPGSWINVESIKEVQPLPVAWVNLSSTMEGTRYEDIFTEEKNKTFLDILNVAYVAFTRAIDKLFIFSTYPANGKFSDKNMAGLLHQFTETTETTEKGQKIFIFGEDFILETKNKDSVPEKRSENIFKEYTSHPWSGKITIRSRQLDNDPDEAITEKQAERGSLIHQVMERIYSPADVDHVLKAFFDTGEISKEQKEDWQIRIEKIIQHSELAMYYNPAITSKNECGMYDQSGKFLRADRVVFSGEKVIVIDYKTGSKNDLHRNQIKEYAQVIQKMGYQQVEKYLVYFDLDVVERL
ncbi:MAG: UvrD-helicase domain-containing protein [Bacteroidales bacterium]